MRLAGCARLGQPGVAEAGLVVAGSRRNEHREYVGCMVEEETPRWKKNIMRLELGMFD
jgi:hypothetical protein